MLRWPGARGQINLSFIDSTPVANLAALTGWLVCMYLLLELLELGTLDTRRFLFRLPESLSRRPDPVAGAAIRMLSAQARSFSVVAGDSSITLPAMRKSSAARPAQCGFVDEGRWSCAKAQPVAGSVRGGAVASKSAGNGERAIGAGGDFADRHHVLHPVDLRVLGLPHDHHERAFQRLAGRGIDNAHPYPRRRSSPQDASS